MSEVRRSGHDCRSGTASRRRDERHLRVVRRQDPLPHRPSGFRAHRRHVAGRRITIDSAGLSNRPDGQSALTPVSTPPRLAGFRGVAGVISRIRAVVSNIPPDDGRHGEGCQCVPGSAHFTAPEMESISSRTALKGRPSPSQRGSRDKTKDVKSARRIFHCLSAPELTDPHS